jgi:hypothetical protein
VFSQLTRVGLFAAKGAILHLLNFDLQEVHHPKLIELPQGNNVLDAPGSNTHAFLWEIHVFLTLPEQAHLEQNEHFFTLKTQIRRKYSFQKPIQFSQVNNVLVAPADNTHSLLCRETCVSSIKLMKLIWSKMSLSPPWKVGIEGHIPFKN